MPGPTRDPATRITRRKRRHVFISTWIILKNILVFVL